MTDHLHELALLVLGLAALGVVALPHILRKWPLSFPIVLVAGGAIAFALPLGLPNPDPIEYSELTEILTELGVITALMGAGLAINRVPGWREWSTTVRWLAITMPVTIAAIAGLGWWVLGLTPAAAVLLGAVLAPTDPVLAGDVQVPGPNGDGDDDEVRFALTSEAGLNDGLAFPFTNLAILDRPARSGAVELAVRVPADRGRIQDRGRGVRRLDGGTAAGVGALRPQVAARGCATGWRPSPPRSSHMPGPR